MDCIKSFISTIFNGAGQAYIYIWVSKAERFIYVGQTNERTGTLGRSYGHVQPCGTLRMRCIERIGLEIEKVNDLYLFTFPLPSSSEFISNESSFRLAIEYLVQYGLHEAKKDLAPSFHVISNIATTSHTSNSQVRKIATEIIDKFKENYVQLQSG